MSNLNGVSKKPITVFGVEFVYLYLVGMVFAFIGWIAENTAKLLSNRVIDSRFHIFPFIAVYIAVSFAFHIVLGTPDDVAFCGKKIFKVKTTKTKLLSNLISFLVISVTVFLGELVVGNMWDILFDVKLWDYSAMPLNLTQYTSIVSTLGFGLGAYLIFKFIYTPLLNLFKTRFGLRASRLIVSTLGVLIAADGIRMILCIIFMGEAPMYWSVNFR